VSDISFDGMAEFIVEHRCFGLECRIIDGRFAANARHWCFAEKEAENNESNGY